MLRYGQEAPAFSLPSTSGRDISLAEFKGVADVVLLFYCYELCGLGEVAAQLQASGAVLLGISGDSPFSHAEFHKRHQLPFPLLSDVHRTVIRDYGLLDEERNVAYRSTVIIDRDGRLRWSQAGDRQMTRSGAEILRVLDLIGKLRSAG